MIHPDASNRQPQLINDPSNCNQVHLITFTHSRTKWLSDNNLDFNTFAVLSRDPVAMNLPFGDTVTVFISLLWAFMIVCLTLKTLSPSLSSTNLHSLSDWSFDPLTTNVSSARLVQNKINYLAVIIVKSFTYKLLVNVNYCNCKCLKL